MVALDVLGSSQSLSEGLQALHTGDTEERQPNIQALLFLPQDLAPNFLTPSDNWHTRHRHNRFQVLLVLRSISREEKNVCGKAVGDATLRFSCTEKKLKDDSKWILDGNFQDSVSNIFIQFFTEQKSFINVFFHFLMQCTNGRWSQRQILFEA